MLTVPPSVPGSKRATGANRYLWLVLLILLAAISGVSVYKLSPLLSPEPMLLAPLDPACDLRATPCVARFPGGGELTLEVEPRAIPVVTPLVLSVSMKGIQASRVEVDFAGLDMNMGYNRVTLEPLGEGRYRGQGMLPICVRNRMTWEARVLVYGPGGLLAAPFRFETRRSN